MKKNQQIDILFNNLKDDFKNHHGKFISDGIINEELYDNQSRKVLFIAKEANDPKQMEWDFRYEFNQVLKYAFAYRIAEWSYGILNNFPDFDSIYKDGYPELYSESIKSIAFMNIKKTGGGGKSNYSELESHLKNNLPYLKRQIDIIKPDIIICSLSWRGLRNILFNNVKWRNSGYNIEIGRRDNIKIIDFYHPSSRNAPSASYSLLQNVITSKVFKEL